MYRFNGGSGPTKPQDLALAIIIFKYAVKIDIYDCAFLSMCKTAIKNLAPQNVALVFTFCDESLWFDKDYAKKWYTCVSKACDDSEMPTFTNERILLFRGDYGQGGPMTSHNEIVSFVQSIIPRKEAKLRR